MGRGHAPRVKEGNHVSELMVDVTFTCGQLEDTDLRDAGVVVVDILRASTTVTQALAAGASEILPVGDHEEASVLAEAHGAKLGGERGGLRLDGFDLGNSPLEYVPNTVAGRTVVLTTSNGTRAMQLCGDAQWALIGSFNNLEAVMRYIQFHLPPSLIVACAGTDGGRAVAPEDVLFAGMLLQRLKEHAELTLKPGGGGVVSLGYASSCGGLLADSLLDTPHGRHLCELDMANDVRWAAQLSVVDSVGVLREDEAGMLRVVQLEETETE